VGFNLGYAAIPKREPDIMMPEIPGDSLRVDIYIAENIFHIHGSRSEVGGDYVGNSITSSHIGLRSCSDPFIYLNTHIQNGSSRRKEQAKRALEKLNKIVEDALLGGNDEEN